MFLIQSAGVEEQNAKRFIRIKERSLSWTVIRVRRLNL